jgi:dolichol-phosphate mannosyltransferase
MLLLIFSRLLKMTDRSSKRRLFLVNALSQNPVHISIVMPALNEQNNIVEAVTNVQSSLELARLQGQLILVNDGSQDATGSLMLELQQRFPKLNIEIISHPTAYGIGASFRDGLKIAKGESIVMLPGDGENDGYEIFKYFNLLGHVDLIIPYVGNGAKRSTFRRSLSKTYITLINLFFGTSFRYTNGTVLYRKSILDSINLLSNGFFYQTELILKCAARDYFYAEVPYLLRAREKGRSTAVSFKNLINIIKSLAYTWISIRFLDRNRGLDKNSATQKLLDSAKNKSN